MSQVTTSPALDFGQIYAKSASNHVSPTTDVIGAAIADKTIRQVKENWGTQFDQYNFLTERA